MIVTAPSLSVRNNAHAIASLRVKTVNFLRASNSKLTDGLCNSFRARCFRRGPN